MADNTELNLGTGGDVVASDDIGGVKYPRSKLGHGADGSYNEVQGTDPLPTVPGTYHTGRLTKVNVTATASGDTSVVTATASQTTKVYRLILENCGTADVSIKLRSASTDLCPALLLVRGGSITLDFSGEPWYVTATNEALNINLSVAGTVNGTVWYIKSA